MTRKDFERIAQALNNSNPKHVYAVLPKAVEEQYEITCEQMADSLAATNPRFDRAKFLEACGVCSK